jgi:hypothetical protein
MSKTSKINWFRNDTVASQLVALADTFPSSLRTELSKFPLSLERDSEILEALAHQFSKKTGVPYMVFRIYVASELCKAAARDNGIITEELAWAECDRVRVLMSDESLIDPAWAYLSKCGVILE